MLETVKSVGSSGYGITRTRETTWLRTSRSGRIIAYRTRLTSASGKKPAHIGTETAFDLTECGPRDPTAVGGNCTRLTYDPSTGKTSTLRLLDAKPSTAFAVQAARAVRQAQHRPHVRIVQRADYVAISHRRVEDHGGLRETREWRLDPKTYEPFFTRQDSTTRIDGRRVASYFSERVLSRRELPDTVANRRFLKCAAPRDSASLACASTAGTS